MATVYWVGRQRVRQQVDEITIGSNTAGHTFAVTAGGRKSVTYTAVSGDTTATIAAALLALLRDSAEGEFAELTWEEGSTTSKVAATGPDDGKPFTLAVSGTGTISTTTLTAPLSPHDLNDGANYSGNALPSGGDTLVFEDSAIDAKYNAAALTAIALTVVRRASYTGRWGLPAESDAGYPEYRPQHLELNSTSILVEQPASDAAGQFRVKATAGGAATVTVRADGGGQLGGEALEVYGLAASSVVRLSGGGVAIAPLAGQAAAVATLTALDAAVRCGSGVTLTDAALKDCQARLDCSYTTLTQTVGGRTEVTGSAAGGNAGTKVYKGSLVWRSTGALGNSPVIGGGGVIDFGLAPGSVAVGGTVELNAGAAWLDPAGRVATAYNVKLVNCRADEVTLDVGTNKTLAVS